jgi:hypothetical protein
MTRLTRSPHSRRRALRLLPLEDRSLLSSVQGTVFDDANSNQVFDTGESGLPGWAIYVDNNANSIIDAGEFTGVNGDYYIDLSSLPSGDYSLGLDLQAGSGGRWVSVAPWLGAVNTTTEPNAIRNAGLVFEPYVSVEPVGPESLVNVTTANLQGGEPDQGLGGPGIAPNAVAANAAGDYVIAWRSVDAVSTRVMARLFHSDGTAASGEITVASNLPSFRNPQVAIALNGRFVVAWSSTFGPDHDEAATFARAYNANGTPATAAITVAAASSNSANLMSDVAIDAVGNFAVLYRNWKPRPSPANNEQATLKIQRFTSAGATIGKAISAADTGAYYHFRQSVAMDATGRFVVVWDDGARSIFAQKYSTAGQKVGSQITVTSTSFTSWQSYVTMNDSGRFVVTWSLNEGSTAAIKAQVYDWGTPVGGNITLATGNSVFGWPDAGCDIDAANNVTFAWGTKVASGFQGTAGAQLEVAFRRLTGAGLLEPTYLVNATTQGIQIYPGVAALSNDKFVVVWQGYGPGDDSGIFMQQFDGAVAPRPGNPDLGDDTTFDDSESTEPIVVQPQIGVPRASASAPLIGAFELLPARATSEFSVVDRTIHADFEEILPQWWGIHLDV